MKTDIGSECSDLGFGFMDTAPSGVCGLGFTGFLEKMPLGLLFCKILSVV